MKTSVILGAILAVVSAIEIDWSKVRPIEEFDSYWNRLPAGLRSLRKLHPDRRITYGQEAAPGQFPYQAVLLIEFPEGTALCGGSILTANYILTVAHCVAGAIEGIVVVGAHDIGANEPSQQVKYFGSSDIQYHAGFDEDWARNDIATIRINSPMTFTDRVQPVRLPADGDNRSFAGFMGTVSGHGEMENGDISFVLRFTSNPIMTRADCLIYWQWPELIQDQNICMTGTDGRATCSGDSGGPLTVADGGNSVQVGIVSFGSAFSCTDGKPTVYARVTYFRDWILQHSDLK